MVLLRGSGELGHLGHLGGVPVRRRADGNVVTTEAVGRPAVGVPYDSTWAFGRVNSGVGIPGQKCGKIGPPN
jgi:hypothetical protein